MSFDLSTKTALAARQTIAYCAKLPAGEQYLNVPRPEARRFVCPYPCGASCQLDQPARYQAVEVRRHACHLNLSRTLELLKAAALQPEAPLACDLGEPAEQVACGPVYLN